MPTNEGPASNTDSPGSGEPLKKKPKLDVGIQRTDTASKESEKNKKLFSKFWIDIMKARAELERSPTRAVDGSKTGETEEDASDRAIAFSLLLERVEVALLYFGQEIPTKES